MKWLFIIFIFLLLIHGIPAHGDEHEEEQKSFITQVIEKIKGFFLSKQIKNTVTLQEIDVIKHLDTREKIYSLTDKFNINEILLNIDSNKNISNGQCHINAHLLGKIGYEKQGISALNNCSIVCYGGCYHGVMEEYLKTNSEENIMDILREECLAPQFNSGEVFSCLHGAGHGILAMLNYDLPEAIVFSGELPSEQERIAFDSGVFMENALGPIENQTTIQHFSAYATSDPEYPCTILEEKDKSMCYGTQSLRFLALGMNFKEHEKICDGLAEKKYVKECYYGIGKVYSELNKRELGEFCNSFDNETHSDVCVMGVLATLFAEDIDLTMPEMCLYTSENFREKCYEYVLNSLHDRVTEEEKEEVCGYFPEKFIDECLSMKPDRNLDLVNAIYYISDNLDDEFNLEKKKVTKPIEGILTLVFQKQNDSYEYTPNKIKIHVNDTVTFVNGANIKFWPASNIHPTHGIYSDFDSKKSIESGSNWSFTFDKNGTWRFHDHLNPVAGGIIYVEN